MKVAVTVKFPVMITVQLPTPPQPAPLQPVKSEPAAALALRVTVLPPGKVAVQLPGQVMPAGSLVTLPPPVPAKNS